MRLNRTLVRTLGWQIGATLVVAVIAGLSSGSAGLAGLISACLGGGVGIAGAVVYALLAKKRSTTPGGVLRTVLRAEAAKISTIVLLLWLVVQSYQALVILAFFGAFMVSVLLSGIAFAVNDD